MREDRICPYCGKVNRNLYLDETDGWMECIDCGKVSKDFLPVKVVEIPVLKQGSLRNQGFSVKSIYSVR